MDALFDDPWCSASEPACSLLQVHCVQNRAANEIFHERRCHGHNSINYPSPAIDRGATSLAVQFWLGILAQRGAGPDPFDCTCSRVAGTHLSVDQDSVWSRNLLNFATSDRTFGSETIRGNLRCQKKNQSNGHAKMNAGACRHPPRRANSCARKWSIYAKANMARARRSKP